MVIKHHCPKCGKKKAIRYGRFILSNKQSAPRIRCLSCKRTSTIREPFFNRIRLPEDKIYEAITSYIQLKTIRTIAQTLEVCPNTVTNWVKRVCEQAPLYKEYLKNAKGLVGRNAIKFFSDLRRAVRVRAIRTDKHILEAGLEQIFKHFEEQNIYQAYHPVSSGRYGKNNPIRPLRLKKTRM